MIMKLGPRTKRRAAAGLLLLPLLAACAATKTDGSSTAAVDPPPARIEEDMLAMAAEAGGALSPGGVTSAPMADSRFETANAALEDALTVYLRDAHGYLAPMTMRLGGDVDLSSYASTEGLAKAALTWLIQDPGRADQLPEGFASVVPVGASVRSVKTDAKTGTIAVDFGTLPTMKAAEERQMLESIVWTLTEIPGFEKVKLSVGGKPIRSLPGSSLPVDEVLTRGFGINVERAEGVQPARSMAVTLYFSANTAAGDRYFVPVTRLVDRTRDRMHAALEQLISGPLDKSALHATLTKGVTLDHLELAADTVNVALRDAGWSKEAVVPAEMMESIVLTVTGTGGVPQVKVAMNGDDAFLDSEQRSYEHPVTRPVAVNVYRQ